MNRSPCKTESFRLSSLSRCVYPGMCLFFSTYHSFFLNASIFCFNNCYCFCNSYQRSSLKEEETFYHYSTSYILIQLCFIMDFVLKYVLDWKQMDLHHPIRSLSPDFFKGSEFDFSVIQEANGFAASASANSQVTSNSA